MQEARDRRRRISSTGQPAGGKDDGSPVRRSVKVRRNGRQVECVLANIIRGVPVQDSSRRKARSEGNRGMEERHGRTERGERKEGDLEMQGKGEFWGLYS